MTRNLKEFSDTDLREELSRRAKEAEEDRKRKHSIYAEAVSKALTREIVDVLASHHQRGDCSDSNLENGFYTSGWNGVNPSCVRCGLLELLKHGERLPDGIYLNLEITEMPQL